MISGPGSGVRAVGAERVRLSTRPGTVRVGTFHPLTSTTGAADPGALVELSAPDAAKVRRQGQRFAGPQRDVVVAPQDRQQRLAAPDRLIEMCWNSARAPEDGGTVRVTVTMSSAPSCRIDARTWLAAVGKDCRDVRSAYRVTGVRYQVECAQSSSSVWVESQ